MAGFGFSSLRDPEDVWSEGASGDAPQAGGSSGVGDAGLPFTTLRDAEDVWSEATAEAPSVAPAEKPQSAIAKALGYAKIPLNVLSGFSNLVGAAGGALQEHIAGTPAENSRLQLTPEGQAAHAKGFRSGLMSDLKGESFRVPSLGTHLREATQGAAAEAERVTGVAAHDLFTPAGIAGALTRRALGTGDQAEEAARPAQFDVTRPGGLSAQVRGSKGEEAGRLAADTAAEFGFELAADPVTASFGMAHRGMRAAQAALKAAQGTDDMARAAPRMQAALEAMETARRADVQTGIASVAGLGMQVGEQGEQFLEQGKKHGYWSPEAVGPGMQAALAALGVAGIGADVAQQVHQRKFLNPAVEAALNPPPPTPPPAPPVPPAASVGRGPLRRGQNPYPVPAMEPGATVADEAMTRQPPADMPLPAEYGDPAAMDDVLYDGGPRPRPDMDFDLGPMREVETGDLDGQLADIDRLLATGTASSRRPDPRAAELAALEAENEARLDAEAAQQARLAAEARVARLFVPEGRGERPDLARLRQIAESDPEGTAGFDITGAPRGGGRPPASGASIADAAMLRSEEPAGFPPEYGDRAALDEALAPTATPEPGFGAGRVPTLDDLGPDEAAQMDAIRQRMEALRAQQPPEVPPPTTGADAAAAGVTEKRAAGEGRISQAKVAGLPLSIEHAAGTSRREGWPALAAHYGYVRGSRAKDGDHVDVYVKPGTPDEYEGPVFAVNQTKRDGSFDETKNIIGAANEREALDIYLASMPPGWTGYSGVGRFESAAAFRDWIDTPAVKKPVPVTLPRPRSASERLPAQPSERRSAARETPDGRRARLRAEHPEASERTVEKMAVLEERAESAEMNDLSQLPGKAAFHRELRTHRGPWGSLDVGGLGYVNDHMGGHQAGDAFLRMVGEEVRTALEEFPGVRAFHYGGDELALAADNPAVLQGAAEAIQARVLNAQFGGQIDGRDVRFKGARIDYGVDPESFKAADDDLKRRKNEAAAAGLRLPAERKGQRPPTFREIRQRPEPSAARDSALLDSDAGGSSGVRGEPGPGDAPGQPAPPEEVVLGRLEAAIDGDGPAGRAAGGKLGYVPALREALADILPGETFDRQLMSLMKAERIQMQGHPVPAQLSPAERAAMIFWPDSEKFGAMGDSPMRDIAERNGRGVALDGRPPGTYLMAAGLRDGGPAATPAAAPSPTPPLTPTPASTEFRRTDGGFTRASATTIAQRAQKVFGKEAAADELAEMIRAARRAGETIPANMTTALELLRPLPTDHLAPNAPVMDTALRREVVFLGQKNGKEMAKAGHVFVRDGDKVVQRKADGLYPVDERGLVVFPEDAHLTAEEREALDQTAKYLADQMKGGDGGRRVFVPGGNYSSDAPSSGVDKIIGIPSDKTGTPFEDMRESPREIIDALERDRGNAIERRAREAAQGDESFQEWLDLQRAERGEGDASFDPSEFGDEATREMARRPDPRQKSLIGGEDDPRLDGLYGTATTRTRADGYVLERGPDGEEYEHRRVAERMLGRPLRPSEVVHHLNGDGADNRPENLEVLPSRDAHQARHPEGIGAPGRAPRGAYERTKDGDQALIPGTLDAATVGGIKRKTEGREAEGPLFTQAQDAAQRAQQEKDAKAQGGLFGADPGPSPKPDAAPATDPLAGLKVGDRVPLMWDNKRWVAELASLGPHGRTFRIRDSRDNYLMTEGERWVREHVITDKVAPPEPEATKPAIADFGAHIGGSRKERAVPLGSRGATAAPKDDRPAWRRKYEAFQNEREVQEQGADKAPWHIKRDGKVVYDSYSYGRNGKAFATKDAAEAAIPLHAVAHAHSAFPSRTDQGKYDIVRKVGERGRPVVKSGFDSREDALRYMVENPDEILAFRFNEPERPWLDSITRDGADRRDGKDVTPDQFQKDFGFKGGQFGNWNMGGDGQAALNHAFDALHDLADTLAIPPRALSLNGDLAIAFGARGTGGKVSASAHYERDYGVINLTKIKGAGALAHEWFHALDHYLGRQDGKAKGRGETGLFDASKDRSRDFVTYGFSGDRSGVRPEVRAAFDAFVKVMTAKAETVGVDASAAEKRLSYVSESLRRTLDDLFRSMSSADQAKYNKRWKAPTPEQTAEWERLANGILHGDVGEKVYVEGKGRLSMERQSTTAIESLNSIYKAVTGRSFATADQNSTGRRVRQLAESAADARARVAAAGEGAEETRTTASDYLKGSKRIDEVRAESYWSTPHEMAARAFEAFVQDRVRSDYLAHGADNRRYMGMKPYPEGAERTAISDAVDNLFRVLQTKDTEKGVALFSPRKKQEPKVDKYREAEKSAVTLDGGFTAINTDSETASMTPSLAKAAAPILPAVRSVLGSITRLAGVRANLAGLTLGRSSKAVVRGNAVRVNPLAHAELAARKADAQAEQHGLSRGARNRVVRREMARHVVNDLLHEVSHIEADARAKNDPELKRRLGPDGHGLKDDPQGNAFQEIHREIRTKVGGRNMVRLRESLERSLDGEGAATRSSIEDAYGQVQPIWRESDDAEGGSGQGGPARELSGQHRPGSEPAQVPGARPRAPEGGPGRGAVGGVRREGALRRGLEGEAEVVRPGADVGRGEAGEPAREVAAPNSSEAPNSSTDTTHEKRRIRPIPPGATPNRSPRNAEPAPVFSIPEETRGDLFLRKVQDQLLRITRTQEAVVKQGGRVTEASDVAARAGTYRARMSDAQRAFDEEHTKPLTKAIADAKLTTKDLDDYVYARHALDSRNRVMAERSGIEGGSGMTDERAREILAGFERRGVTKKLEPLAQRIYRVAKEDRERRVRAGLMTREQADTWEKTFGHTYVSLRHTEEQGDAPRTGRGYSVGGKESKKALGRTTEADSPVAWTLAQAKATIDREERNHVGQALVRFVKDNPDPTLWQLNKKHVTRVEGPLRLRVKFAGQPARGTGALLERAGFRWQEKAGEWTARPTPKRKALARGLDGARVEETRRLRTVPDTLAMSEDFKVKVDGREERVWLADPLQRRALNSLNPDQAGEAVRWLDGSLQLFKALVTRYSPEFFFVNPFRDVQAGLLALKVERGAEIAKEAARNIRRAMAAMWRVARDPKAADEWAQHAREFKKAGGSTGVYGYERTAEGLEKQLEREVQVMGGGRVDYGIPLTSKTVPVPAKAVRVGRAVLKLIEDANEAAEGAVRLAAYVALRKAGKSVDEAATIARNLTVDFSKKGEWGPLVNSGWAFFNANVQGSRRVYEVLTSKSGKKAAGAIFGAGLVMDLVNSALLSGDADSDGTNDYDEIEEHVKQKSFIIATGRGSVPLMFPMPHGFNVLHVAGRLTGEWIRGAKTSEQAAAALTSAALGAFNPLGGESNLVQQASPTLFDPIVQHVTGENFAGNPVRPRPFPGSAPKPDSRTHFKTVSPRARDLAYWMNDSTGGDEVTPGAIDVSPETIEHVMQFLTGGLGRFASQALAAGERAVAGERQPIRETPVLRRFLYEPHPSNDSSRYYENREELAALEQRAKFYLDADDRTKLAELPRPLLVVKREVDRIETEIRRVRRDLKEQKVPQEIADKKIQALQARANARVAAARRAPHAGTWREHVPSAAR